MIVGFLKYLNLQLEKLLRDSRCESELGFLNVEWLAGE